MGPPALTLLPLVVIAALTAFVLLMAWQGFGRVRHALVWSAAFALLAVMWVLRLLGARHGAAWIGDYAASVLGGAAVLLGAVGFRIRARRRLHGVRLGLIYGMQIAATAALIAAGHSDPIASIPGYLQDLVMLIVAARTLNGRRRGERATEIGVHIAVLGGALWMMLRLAEAIGLGARLPEARVMANLVQPAAVLAVALAAIFVIAADLAQQLRRVANTDRLTGLLNRRGFDEALAAILASARRYDRTMALLVTDIDRFKRINDRYGHALGDEVIRQFGACLERGVARRDLVARIGGEEFALLLADVDESAALCAAEVLRTQIAELRFEAAAPLRITASFGLTVFGEEDLSRPHLLARADAALYQSKSGGRNRVTVAA